MKNWLRAAFLAFPVLTASSVDCTYLQDPSGFLRTPEQRWREVSGWTEQVDATKGPMPSRYRMDSPDAPLPRKISSTSTPSGEWSAMRFGRRPCPPTKNSYAGRTWT